MTDARLLTLVQWLSPAYPLGSFAYSHGVEQGVADGWITDADSLRDWLEDVLRHGSGRSDAIWLRLAAAGFVDDALARSYLIGAERLMEAERQGAAFARLAREVWGLDVADTLLPLAVGRAAAALKMEVGAVAAVYLSGFVSNLIAGAQRLMPLGQTGAQRVHADLHATCLSVAAETEGCGLDDILSCAHCSEIAAMRHETLQPRLFTT
ncbi:urease accessory protein UreF [Salipiger sp. IMCC34102]|uniref:urease accessory protein UreF n=1 Tax=Salipiger sp. IMCC34102 TaxID=2510647 RepID=UPI00101C97D0|nr:urease accessory UreF family protein [Salipiger sp. IMCC34102]RYH01270.1 urease accessory protein UreF [Salipiger sp. IMCC34102]